MNHHETPAGPTREELPAGPAGTNPDLPAPRPVDVPALLSLVSTLCAELGITVTRVSPSAPDWLEKGHPYWSTPEQDARPCAAVWFRSFRDGIRFQEAPVDVRYEFGCDWGNYGWFGWRGLLLGTAHVLRLRPARGVYGRAIPHDDLPELVAGLERARRAKVGGES